MSSEQSVKEFSFVSYFLFSHNSLDHCASAPLATKSLTLPIALPSLLSDHVEALIKEARYQAKILREDAETEARATAVVAVRPFGDAEKLLLAWGQKYRLDKPDHLLVRLKVEHSVFGTLNIQRFGSKFVKDSISFRSRDEGDGQEGESKPHIPRLLRR